MAADPAKAPVRAVDQGLDQALEKAEAVDLDLVRVQGLAQAQGQVEAEVQGVRAAAAGDLGDTGKRQPCIAFPEMRRRSHPVLCNTESNHLHSFETCMPA